MLIGTKKGNWCAFSSCIFADAAYEADAHLLPLIVEAVVAHAILWGAWAPRASSWWSPASPWWYSPSSCRAAGGVGRFTLWRSSWGKQESRSTPSWRIHWWLSILLNHPYFCLLWNLSVFQFLHRGGLFGNILKKRYPGLYLTEGSALVKLTRSLLTSHHWKCLAAPLKIQEEQTLANSRIISHKVFWTFVQHTIVSKMYLKHIKHYDQLITSLGSASGCRLHSNQARKKRRMMR